MRALCFALILLLAGIAITVSHRAKPLPLLIDAPVVKAAAPAAPDLLFAPCPLGPRNLPFRSERKA